MPKLLILGGTAEASLLAKAVAQRGWPATLSYAGRTAVPKPQPIPVRIGGFGGAKGLKTYLEREEITHLVDATHPFAAQMSWNAAEAAAAAGVPLAALVRPPWTPSAEDDWREAADMSCAVAALHGPPRRIFLAIGRQEVAAFAEAPQHHYLLRYVNEPSSPPPLPRHTLLVARGPFDAESDTALLRAHRIDMIVAKNAGGTGARAKLEAARILRLPAIMIARPPAPKRPSFEDPESLLDRIAHAGTALGV
ncbi:MAG: cobalt-precorrin-6A reductase [Pseudomonadota bacterium]